MPNHPAPDTGPLLKSGLNLAGLRRGKVRDVYDLPPGRDGTPRLLIVATDRISAFDVVMPTPIPGKGATLTAISTFWFRFIVNAGLCKTHLLSTDAAEIPETAFHLGTDTGTRTPRESLVGRITIARRAHVVPIECVVRGYLEGSGWREYQQTGSVCGIALPKGLRQCDRLPLPIFTPATKEDLGKHDENVSFEKAADLVGGDLMRSLRDTSLAIYTKAAEHALARGVIIADTKFEFGFPIDASGKESDTPILIDEALTPDSSRFWPADRYEPGHSQASYDKQFLREYLESLVAKGNWHKSPPGPSLPAHVIQGTVDRYREVAKLLTA
ncbi:MAG: phosphoribosylaminoimidazolesuccinocarboxamide synthase [Phycisphaerales bacterium]|nr:MAG: phosphoribosylaminoimidazolesuccinocarboxamide synthase [Phycisphaerales bacterium]